MHHAVMRICISHRLFIVCAQNGVFGGVEGEDVKILCSNPVNSHLSVYRVSKSVQRPELQVGRKILRTKKKKIVIIVIIIVVYYELSKRN